MLKEAPIYLWDINNNIPGIYSLDSTQHNP